MIQKIFKLACAIVSVLIIGCTAKKIPVEYVDPFICTEGDHGHWHPSALVPFGLVKLGPDTYPSSLTGDGDFAHSGYNYTDTIIRGFSHFHRGSSGGTRIKDRAGVLSVMPFVTSPDFEWVKHPVSEIDKVTEMAEPGFYSVLLNKENILAELTASTFVGFHRYLFPKGEQAKIFLYNGRSGFHENIRFNLVGNSTIEGELKAHGGIHFIIEFNQPLQKTGVWREGKFREIANNNSPIKGGLSCNFGDLNEVPLLIKVGVSLTSLEAAKENMAAQGPDWDFNFVRNRSLNLWNDILSNIQVEGNNIEDKKILYTALYHTCFLPVNQTDVGGTYKGFDGKIHHANGYTHYNGYAFWDSFRNKYPLYSLFIPGIYSDIVSSINDIYEQTDNWKPFPDSNHRPHSKGFEAYSKDGSQAFSTCRHEHMLMVVADAYFKNLFNPDLDIHSIYPHLKNETLLQMPEKYDSIGFIPARPDQTGEYCWDNWCVAQIAKDLGFDKDYNYFIKRSEYWRNTWDPSIKFFRAKAADGTWLDFPEDPTVNREKYTYEGSKWQWRWNLLHDVEAMIKLLGGKENFVNELNYFFENDLYTAGNQIDLHAPFLFNYAGAPWLTQKWTHKILKEPMVQLYGTHDFFEEPLNRKIYKATPDGYIDEMDDDYGCMASWYVLSAMGLYQVCPGNPVYQISSPIFEKITIALDKNLYSGKTFTISAKNFEDKNIYIQSASLNGKILHRAWLTHEEIVKGGELILTMGDKPNKQWGVIK